MPAVPKHRQPIINTAVTLFRRQGYSRTGLNEIVEMSGAPKGSLYHYFPLGKSSIGVAAVKEAGCRVAATLTKLAEECRSTGELLRRHAPNFMDQPRPELFHHPKIGLLVVLALNILIVWYLLANRKRLFRHHD